MPSKTYWNLPEEKKEKLLKAAMSEFSRVLLSDASINRIIKDADISRGSFYMYFESKEDLYAYILREHRMNGIRILLDALQQNKGDIIKAYQTLYSVFLEKCFEEKEKSFFQNVFQNANLYIESKTGLCCFSSNEEEELFQKLCAAIDLEKLSKNARESVPDVIKLLFDITMKNILPVILMNIEKEEAFNHFLKSLQLIEGGIYK